MRLRGTRAYAAPDMTRIAAILPAAGMGTRMGAETPKQFLELNGTPIVILSLRRIASCTLVTDLIVATRADEIDRKSTRLNSSHGYISYAVFCLKKKNTADYERATLYAIDILSERAAV